MSYRQKKTASFCPFRQTKSSFESYQISFNIMMNQPVYSQSLVDADTVRHFPGTKSQRIRYGIDPVFNCILMDI